MISLANRISFAAVAMVAIFGALAGYALYDKVRRSLKDEMEGRQNIRLAWIESALEYDDYHIGFSPKNVPDGAAELWQVSTRDGLVLWKSGDVPALSAVKKFSAESRHFALGDSNFAAISGHSLRRVEESQRPYVIFELPTGRIRVELLLTARTPSEAMYMELSRLRWALFAIVPVGTVALALLLTWFVRIQLRPLEAVAQRSAAIGPSDTRARIDVPANALEIVQLRDAINGMISRMSEGFDRERRFSSFAAHELRTPLAQLRTNIEVTLRRERDVAEYRHSMQEALLDIERLQKLVTDLLHLTRTQEATVAQNDHAALDVVITQAARASGQPVNLADGASPAIVRGNEELLISAVRNVLENAARYAPESSPTLNIESDSKLVRLRIADCGPGIPESERERIFQPLTRLDSARSITDQNGGFGLGLAIARTAVRACGGDLICGPRADGKSGAQFMFVFQRAQVAHGLTQLLPTHN